MTRNPELPILDDHFHLDPRGQGTEAVKAFQRAGGTHLIVVHKPYQDPTPTTKEEHEDAMGTTLRMAKEAHEATDVIVHAALGPHPAELTANLDAGLSLEEAREAYEAGLEAAQGFIEEGDAIALGEIGRPHYPVADEVWEVSNELFRQALKRAADAQTAAILHTETATPETMRTWATWADEAGLKRERVVNHFSPPIVTDADNHGLTPSILASRENLQSALEDGNRFLMETDYMDDPDRPGAVLGPKLVPRRTLQLHEEGALSEDDWARIHIETPREAYGIDTNA